MHEEFYVLVLSFDVTFLQVNLLFGDVFGQDDRPLEPVAGDNSIAFVGCLGFLWVILI